MYMANGSRILPSNKALRCVFSNQICRKAIPCVTWTLLRCYCLRTLSMWHVHIYWGRVTLFIVVVSGHLKRIHACSILTCGQYLTHWTLHWRHNGRDSVSNHQPHDCLLNRLFRRRSKKTSKIRVTGLCEGNSPGTGEFPAQMASNAENGSIWWRHHGPWHNGQYFAEEIIKGIFLNKKFCSLIQITLSLRVQWTKFHHQFR